MQYFDAGPLRVPTGPPAFLPTSTLFAMAYSIWSAGFRHRVLSSVTRKPWLRTTPFRRLETTSATAESSPTYRAKKDSLLSPTMILLGIIPIFTFALGTWQVERLKWKINLIDELQEKLSREPMALPRKIKYENTQSFDGPRSHAD